MGTGYTRNDTANNIADGNIINASDLDGEFDAIVSAFGTSGHTHDGTAAEGGAITVLGPAQQVTVSATALYPSTANAVALGTTSNEFSDLYMADGSVIYLGADQDVTLTHVADTGILLNSTRQLQFGDSGSYIHQSADGVLDLVSDTEIEINATTIDMNGAVEISGNTTVGGTLTSTGKITADAGIDIDNFNIDGTTIALSSGDMTLDGAGDILLDAAGEEVIFKDGSTNVGHVSMDSDNLTIKSLVSDKDIIFQGNDGGSGITALTLDMSEAGAATFNNKIVATELDISGDADIDGTLEADAITVDGTALATYIRDTVGTNMLSSNTESGITVTYDTSNDNIDFAIDAAQTTITSVLATDLKVGEDDQTKIDFEDADQINFYADNAKRVTIDSTGLTVNSGSIETATIDYTDGDNAMTIADGGKVTFAAGFDVGSDASGDILYHNGTSYVRLAKGTDDQVLTLASGVPSWASSAGDITGVTAGTGLSGGGTSGAVTVNVEAAQTGITSLLATDIKIGEDDQTKIDFETADEIHFYAANVEQVYLADNIFGPQTDSDVDLGTTGVRWKDAYVDSVTVTDNVSIGGTLTVNGTTTTVNSTTVTVDDPIFTLGGDTAPGTDDNKDRGIEFRYHTGTAAKVGFFGYDDSAEVFTFIPDATNSSEVFSGTVGNAAFGNVAGTLTTAAQTNITSVGALDGGSISSGFGAIDTGSSNITTTGLISGGSLDIDDVLINGTTIGHTDDTDLMTLSNGGLVVAGTLEATGNITGTLATAAQTNITSTGALDGGSITSGFGAIDNGTSGIRTNTFTAETSILPDAVGGADLGSTSAEWGDIYIADDKAIKFGNDQDVTMEYDEDGTDSLLISGSDVTIVDDKKLYFGTNQDVYLEYDEDGTDKLIIKGHTTFLDGAYNFDIASHDGTNGLALAGTVVTSSAAELNKLDGISTTATELGYVNGVTSAIQTQLNAKATTGKSIAMAMVFG